MNLYFIDFENVNESGLNGIEHLNNNDKVIIFNGDRPSKISFEHFEKASESGAKIEFVKTSGSGKNYLDFQMITYLGYLIGQSKPSAVYLITKDSGYDAAVDFWQARQVKICRQEVIFAEQEQPKKAKGKLKKADVKGYRGEIKKAVKEDELRDEDYGKIYKALASSKSLKELRNNIFSEIKNKNKQQKENIYKHINPIYQEMHHKKAKKDNKKRNKN